MDSESLVSFVDPWIRLVRNRFTEKFAERLPAVFWLVLEEVFWRDQRSHVLVMPDEAFAELGSVGPVAGCPVG